MSLESLADSLAVSLGCPFVVVWLDDDFWVHSLQYAQQLGEGQIVYTTK